MRCGERGAVMLWALFVALQLDNIIASGLFTSSSNVHIVLPIWLTDFQSPMCRSTRQGRQIQLILVQTQMRVKRSTTQWTQTRRGLCISRRVSTKRSFSRESTCNLWTTTRERDRQREYAFSRLHPKCMKMFLVWMS